MSKLSCKELIEVKNPATYGILIKKAIQAISININNTIPFGSFTSKVTTYPSDIDLLELVEIKGSKKKAAKKIALALSKLISNLPDIFLFSEGKAGIDERYNIEGLGNDINDYNYEEVNDNIKKLYKQKLFDKKEYDELNKLVNKKITNDQYNRLRFILRNKWIIRWDKDEIIKKIKILPGNLYITLKDACLMTSPIKMDIFVPLYCRYVEVTNFYILKNKIGNKSEYINLPKDYDIIVNFQILQEAEKLLYNKEYYSPFKALRRIYAVARYKKDCDTMKKLIPAIRSDISKLNQIKANIISIIAIIEKGYIDRPFTYTFIFSEIDNFSYRLASIIDFEIPKKVYDDINYILKNENKISYKIFIEKLESIKNIITKIINEKALKYLKKIKFYPLPKNYLAENNKYNRPSKTKISNKLDFNITARDIPTGVISI